MRLLRIVLILSLLATPALAEQQLFENNLDTTLSTGVTSSGTTLVIADATGFPSPGAEEFFLITLFTRSGNTVTNTEIVKCTSRSGTSLTVERGQEETAAVSHNAGAQVSMMLTAAALERLPTDSQKLALDSAAYALSDSNPVIDQQSFTRHTGDGALHLTPDQNAGLDAATGISGTNRVATVDDIELVAGITPDQTDALNNSTYPLTAANPVVNQQQFDELTSDGVALPSINGAVTLEDQRTASGSSSYYEGGDFTDNADGTLTVAAGKGFIRATNSATAQLVSFSWDEDAAVSLVDDSTNYIYVSYHITDPPVMSATSKPADTRTNVLLGKVFREGTTAHLFNAGVTSDELVSRVIRHITATHGELSRKSGGVISETGTLNIASTEAVAEGGLTWVTTTAYDTSGADTFEYYYYTGSAWVENDTSAIDNLQYNNPATGLATLAPNQYGVHWVYIDPEGHIQVVYGQDTYAIGEAQDAQPPASLPAHTGEFCWLAAKIIVKKSATSFTEIQSAYDQVFVHGTATEHNELGGLDGGTVDYRGHVTVAQEALLADAVVNADTTTAAMDFVLDEDDMVSDSATKIPTQQSVKAYVDSAFTTVAKTANYPLTAADCNGFKTFTNYGASGTINLTLPAGVTGMMIKVTALPSGSSLNMITVTPASGETITKGTLNSSFDDYPTAVKTGDIFYTTAGATTRTYDAFLSIAYISTSPSLSGADLMFAGGTWHFTNGIGNAAILYTDAYD